MGYVLWSQLKCERCGEVTQKETCVALNETFNPQTCHLVQKCKFCAREGNVTMIPGKGRPLTLKEHAPLMVFDCWGYEPIDFGFGGYWKAEAESGTKFDDIDLSSGEEFTEYDEKGEYPSNDIKLPCKLHRHQVKSVPVFYSLIHYTLGVCKNHEKTVTQCLNKALLNSFTMFFHCFCYKKYTIQILRNCKKI